MIENGVAVWLRSASPTAKRATETYGGWQALDAYNPTSAGQVESPAVWLLLESRGSSGEAWHIAFKSGQDHRLADASIPSNNCGESLLQTI